MSAPASSPFISRAVIALTALLALFSTAGSATKMKNTDFGSDAVTPLRTHSIYAPYVESNLQNKFWDFGGDAIVDTNRQIRLTQDRPHQTGYVWSRLPLVAPSYEINFEFRIDGKSHNTFGDGLAMWLTEDRAQPGPVFGSKDYFTGLGIFFDTFANSRHPYAFPRIMAMLGNGVEGYRTHKDGANQELAGCSMDIRRTHVATKARLTFVEGVYLELAIHYKEWDQWETCFKLENIKLPSSPYLGFSALTGDVSDAHDVVSVSTSQIVFKAKSFAELEAERRKHFPKDGSADKKGSVQGYYEDGPGAGQRIKGFFHGFFKLCYLLVKWGMIVAGLAGLVVVGLRWRKARDAKRF